ncbi:hypothetical protein Tco_1316180 [Tanacetum coccineum]
MDNGEECLDGWVGTGGGEVKGGGDDFGVRRIFLGEKLIVIIRESGVKIRNSNLNVLQYNAASSASSDGTGIESQRNRHL